MKIEFIKYETANRYIHDIVDEYNAAMARNNEEKMEDLEEEFKYYQSAIWSSYNYVKNDINATNLYLETDESKKKQNMILLGQRTLYLGNRIFVKNVASAKNIKDFKKKDSRKTLNFVKKHWVKFTLGIATATTIYALSLSGCSKTEKSNEEPTPTTVTEDNNESKGNVTGTTLEDSINKALEATTEVIEKAAANAGEQKTTEDLEVVTSDGYVKLNDLPDFDDTTTDTTTNTNESNDKNNKDNKDNKKKNNNNNDVDIQYNRDKFENKVVTEELDPHVTNDGQKTTTTKVEKEQEAKERKPVDYETKETDNTNINKDEKVTVTEKEIKKEVTTENIPIEGATEPESVEYKKTTEDPSIPTEEKVTIIYEDGTNDWNYSNFEVDENKTTQTQKTDVVIYEEVEIPEEMNTENLPIEGKAKSLVFRM